MKVSTVEGTSGSALFSLQGVEVLTWGNGEVAFMEARNIGVVLIYVDIGVEFLFFAYWPIR